MVAIALIQMTSSDNVNENIHFIKNAISGINTQEVRHIFLPETANFIHSDKEYCLRYAENDIVHPFCDAMSSLAIKYNIFIHIGSLKYKIAHDRLVNRSISYDPSGNICAEYDKIHLFDANISSSEIYKESDLYNAGTTAVSLKCDDFTLGYSICYDLRFPNLYYNLAKMGANVIAVPAAFTVQTGRAHWEILLRARAIETGSYIVAAAQCGKHHNGRQTYGHSMIIAPWGEKIAEITDESVSILLANIDIEQVVTARSKVNSLNHNSCYGMNSHHI